MDQIICTDSWAHLEESSVRVAAFAGTTSKIACCNIGEYLIVNGAATQCSKCPPGKFLGENATQFNGSHYEHIESCGNCPAGFYQVDPEFRKLNWTEAYIAAKYSDSPCKPQSISGQQDTGPPPAHRRRLSHRCLEADAKNAQRRCEAAFGAKCTACPAGYSKTRTPLPSACRAPRESANMPKLIKSARVVPRVDL